MPASPARSPRTRSSPRSATSQRVSLGGFREVFETVTAGAADAGVVPIENVINGTVRENYDLLLEHDLEIRGEVVVPVRLCLAALPGPAPRRHRAGLLAHPGARPGRGVPARAGRGSSCRPTTRPAPARRSPIAASAARRPSSRPEPRACSGSRSSPTRSATSRATGPGSSSSAGPDAAAARRSRPRRRAAGRRSSSLSATSPARCSRSCGSSPTHGLNMQQARVRPSRERAWEYVFWVDLDADAADPAMAARARRARRGVTTRVRAPRRRTARRRPRSGSVAGRSSAPAQAGRLRSSSRISVQEDLLGRRARRRCLLDEELR